VHTLGGMPRPLRSTFPPGYYHVYARGVNRCAIFRTQADCRHFCYLLGRAIRRYRWTCWAFCLMGNHYHLVIETSQPGFSDGLQWLNGLYAARFNSEHKRVGHLFGGRFGAIAIESEEQLATTCDYVLQNPVRAGLCRNATDWPWSQMRRAG
jgi:REP-associated tyrosine transposase